MHLYEEVETWLTDAIESGELKPGDKIPREVELAERFHASRPTVRQALAHLTASGKITRTRGKGSFVCEPKLLQEYTRFISSYRNEMQEKGLQPRTIVIDQERVNARPEIARLLGLKAGQEVVKLSRLRFLKGYNSGKPVLFTTVYIPADLFPSPENCNFETDSLYDTLEKNGVCMKHVRREIEIRTADLRLSHLLEVKNGSPLFYISSIGLLEEGRPAEYSESYYPADSSKFLVEIER